MHTHNTNKSYLLQLTDVLMIWILIIILRESIPRQVDNKSGIPEEEKGVWGSQGGDRGQEFSRMMNG